MRLSAAHSRVNGQQLYLNQAYNVGYWREEQVNDTLTRDVYVPVTKFIWTLDYESGHHIFLNDNTARGRPSGPTGTCSRRRPATTPATPT